jgi:hypothetical protein
MREMPVNKALSFVLILVMSISLWGISQNVASPQKSTDITADQLIRMLKYGNQVDYDFALSFIGGIYSKTINNGATPDRSTLIGLAEIIKVYASNPDRIWIGTAEGLVTEALKDAPTLIEKQKAFWANAYKAAEAYFAKPSPENAEKFFMALPDRPLPHMDSDGELRLINLVFDFVGSGMRKNFSILENKIKEGEPQAVDVGFRLINISDGLAGEEILFALGRIADKHPRLFLQKLRAHQGKTQPDVLELLSDILHPVAWWEQQQDEAGYPELLKKRLKTRINALKSVEDSDLRELRDRCLKLLEYMTYWP